MAHACRCHRQRLRQLAARLPDDQIADLLNSEGYPTATACPGRSNASAPSAASTMSPACAPACSRPILTNRAAMGWFPSG